MSKTASPASFSFSSLPSSSSLYNENRFRVINVLLSLGSLFFTRQDHREWPLDSASSFSSYSLPLVIFSCDRSPDGISSFSARILPRGLSLARLSIPRALKFDCRFSHVADFVFLNTTRCSRGLRQVKA